MDTTSVVSEEGIVAILASVWDHKVSTMRTLRTEPKLLLLKHDKVCQSLEINKQKVDNMEKPSTKRQV